jgi:hypothetical protein
MNCTEPVARSANATNQTVVTSNQAAGVALVHTQPKIRGQYISRREEGHEFRNNVLTGRALYTVPEAMEMLNLSRTGTNARTP